MMLVVLVDVLVFERERDEVEMMMMKGDEDGCEEGVSGSGFCGLGFFKLREERE